MQRGEDAHAHVVPAVDPLTTGYRPQLRRLDTVVAHHADALVGTDDRGAGVLGDRVHAEHVVEVRVTHEHEVGVVDVCRAEPDRFHGGDAVHERVEPERQPHDPDSERRAPEPLDREIVRRRHGASLVESSDARSA